MNDYVCATSIPILESTIFFNNIVNDAHIHQISQFVLVDFASINSFSIKCKFISKFGWFEKSIWLLDSLTPYEL